MIGLEVVTSDAAASELLGTSGAVGPPGAVLLAAWDASADLLTLRHSPQPSSSSRCLPVRSSFLSGDRNVISKEWTGDRGNRVDGPQITRSEEDRDSLSLTFHSLSE